MKKAIDKFINYLDESYKKCMKEINSMDKLKEKNKQLDVMMNIIETLKEELKEENHYEIFQDFDVLSQYLLDSHLNNRECLQVIIYLIEKDIASGFIENNSIDIDGRDILEYPFKTMEKLEVFKMFTTGEITELLATKEKDLTPLKKRQRREMLLFIENNKIDISELVQNIKIIEQHYLKKRNSYQEEDIDKVINALQSIHIHKILCDRIKLVLEKDNQKRKKSISKIAVQEKKGRIPEEDRLEIEKKKENLRQEVATYLNSKEMSPSRPLELEEQIVCATLLTKLNFTREEIQNFFKKAKLVSKTIYKNPIKRYIDDYPRLKYYEEKYGLQEEMKDLEEFFQVIMLANEDDYQFWKSSIEETLQKIDQILPNSLDYELREVENRVVQYQLKR